MRQKAITVQRKSTAAERRDLRDQRCRLQNRIDNLEKKADSFLKLDYLTEWRAEKGKESDDGYESSGYDSDDVSDSGRDAKAPELATLPLPSSLAPGEVERLGLTKIAQQEASLHRGQINDALDGLRLALGEKSLLLRTGVRNAQSQLTTLRAWDSVNKRDNDAKKHRETYRHARDVLIRLGLDDDYLSTLGDITDEDMKMPRDILEENRFGQKSDALPWFWRIAHNAGDGHSDSDNERMKECECGYLLHRVTFTSYNTSLQSELA